MFIRCLVLPVTLAACLGACSRSPVRITPPDIPEGGRALSIAVTLNNDQRIFVTTESGGLFRTFNGGESWQHLGLPNFATLDVGVASLAPSTIIATTQSRYRIPNDGGIWRSTDDGGTWTQPAGSMPPPGRGCPKRPSAHGISHMPFTRTFHVGTDCGIAVSNDNGATWSHFMVDSTDTGSDSLQHRVRSLLILNRTTGVVAADRGVFFLRGTTWMRAGIDSTSGVPVLHAFAAPFWSGTTHIFLHASGDRRIFLSTDAGANWSQIPAPSVVNREAFIRVARSVSGDASAFVAYMGDGQELHRQTFSMRTPKGSAWTLLTSDHPDPSDVAFNLETGAPLLLASDGGVHRTTNQGASWTMTGAGSKGFNALQVAEITGQQVTGSAPHLDLYFATMDNGIRASPDAGHTWPRSAGGEGRHIRIAPTSVNHQGTRVTGLRIALNNSPPPRYQADAHFENVRAWGSAPNGGIIDGSDAPFLIVEDAYVQPAFDTTVTPTSFDYFLTTSAGAPWTKTFTLPQQPKGPAIIAGSPANPTVYQGVDRGAFGDGTRFGLMRASNLAGTAQVRRADSLGMRAMGSLRTPIARYVVFGVDPRNRDHLIAPDIQANEMKFSADGGSTWFALPQLTQAVTDTGRFLFDIFDQSLASVVAWDPYDACSILVGTIQNGIIRSKDGGRTWAPIKGTKAVTWISSFFFPPTGQVWISTNGRGLWRLKLNRQPNTDPARCPFPEPPPGGLPPDTLIIVDPVSSAAQRFTGLNDPAVCPQCTVVTVRGGWITDYDAAGDTLRSIAISSGNISQVNRSGREVPLSVPNGYQFGDGRFLTPNYARALGTRQVRGLVLERNLIRYLIAARDELPFGPAREPTLFAISRGGSSANDVASGDSALVSGRGFLPSQPARILVDGVVAADRVTVRADGTFVLNVAVMRPRGEVVITAEQRDGRRLMVTRTAIDVVGREGR